MESLKKYLFIASLLVCICVLISHLSFAESESSQTVTGKVPTQLKKEEPTDLVKIMPVGPLDISQDPTESRKFTAKIKIQFENPKDESNPFLYMKFDRLENNLVEILPWKVIPGNGLRPIQPSEDVKNQKDPYSQSVPLLTMIDPTSKQKEFLFLLEIPFRQSLDRRNFKCDEYHEGAFKIKLLWSSEPTSDTDINEKDKVARPICVGPIPGPSYTKEEAISLGELYVERALVKKTIADELFLQGKTGAPERYKEAQQSLEEAKKLLVEKKPVLSLLSADIEYRTTLLALGLDFWGGLRSGTPGIPMRHLIALEDLANDFERVTTQMDELYDNAEAQDQSLAKAKAALQEVTGKLNAYTAEKEKAVVSERHERRMIDISWNELRDIQNQQVKIANRLTTLDSLQKNLQSQGNKMLANAVAKSAGLDPKLMEGVRSGKVDTVVRQYIASELGTPSSPLLEKVAEFSKQSQTFVDYYKRAKKATDDFVRLKGQVEFAAEVVRKPSLENLRELGSVLLKELPKADREALEAGIKSQLPATEWIRSAESTLKELKKSDIQLRELIATRIAKSDLTTGDLRRVIFSARDRLLISEAGIARSAEGIREIKRHVLEGLAKGDSTVSGIKAALNAATRTFPESAIKNWPPKLIDLMRLHFKVSTNEQLVTKLEGNALRELTMVTDGLDKLRIRSELAKQEIQVQTSELLSKLDDVQSSDQRAAKELAALFENLLLDSRSHVQVIVAAFPLDVLSSTVSKFKEQVDSAKIVEEVQSYLSKGGLLSKATATAVDRAVGASYAEEVFDSVPLEPKGLADGTQTATPVEEPGAELSASGQPDPATTQLLTTALDAAFPGAGTLVSLAQTFASMDANRELAERLAAEGARLMARTNELVDRQSERYTGALLAEIDQRRAQALADASDAQISTFQNAMRRSVEEKNLQMMKLGIRRGWAFYLAERMREEFDQFDRSFALWARGKAATGVIAQEIRNDPQNVRYALDSQIQLFDWLDRSRESAKTDPDFLRVHWNRMVRLAKDVCQKQGCKPGDGLMGQVGNTREVSIINDLLSAHDRQRFVDWQRNPLGPFHAEFQITPMSGLVPPTAYNVRLIDLRLAEQNHTGSLSTTEQITLAHTGVSYIGVPAQNDEQTVDFQLETLLPRRSSSFNSPKEFDLDALRTRYDSYFTGSNLPSARNFEGYGLFATYELTIEPTHTNRNLKDLVLRAAYYYQHVGSIANEAAFMRMLVKKRGNNIVPKLSSHFPDLAPHQIVIASDTSQCALPLSERSDKELFGRKIQMPSVSYDITSFFAGRSERHWPEMEGESDQVKQLKKRIEGLGKCSNGKPTLQLKPLPVIKDRALWLGRFLDQDKDGAAHHLLELGLPKNAKLEHELPKLAEQEYFETPEYRHR